MGALAAQKHVEILACCGAFGVVPQGVVALPSQQLMRRVGANVEAARCVPDHTPITNIGGSEGVGRCWATRSHAPATLKRSLCHTNPHVLQRLLLLSMRGDRLFGTCRFRSLRCITTLHRNLHKKHRAIDGRATAECSYEVRPRHARELLPNFNHACCQEYAGFVARELAEFGKRRHPNPTEGSARLGCANRRAGNGRKMGTICRRTGRIGRDRFCDFVRLNERDLKSLTHFERNTWKRRLLANEPRGERIDQFDCGIGECRRNLKYLKLRARKARKANGTHPRWIFARAKPHLDSVEKSLINERARLARITKKVTPAFHGVEALAERWVVDEAKAGAFHHARDRSGESDKVRNRRRPDSAPTLHSLIAIGWM
jgi:hypothetical protein